MTSKLQKLLDKASKEQEKPKASIINDAIKAYLSKGGDINSRLNKII